MANIHGRPPPFILEALPVMKIQEPTLRALVTAGSVRELVAQQVNSGDGSVWVLLVRVGTIEAPLERQRGGHREFKSLDAVASLVGSLGLMELAVKLGA